LILKQTETFYLKICKINSKNIGKEARRKELKKNKKQRLLVRQAVLKGKDPKTVLVEMEALDKLGYQSIFPITIFIHIALQLFFLIPEYDPNNPPPYNVKVLQDKRKKLKETWVKVFKLYVSIQRVWKNE
jgi:WW domain-binding protein 11